MISVIMLTCDREDMVSRAIESILGQTYRDFEFIIVDNGSTDHSGRIADTYAARDNRIRVIHREKGNIGAGRNTGLDAAGGKYLTFIDDDDWAEPDFLEFLLDLLEGNGADVAICGAADKAFDEKRVMTAGEALIELMWRKKYNMAFPTKLFRRELVENLRFPEDGVYDDIALMYRLLAEAKRVAYHGLPKYTFYRHGGNNSAWTTKHELLTPETLDEYLRAYRTRTEWLSERFPDNALSWRYFEWSFMISMVEKIHRLEIPGCGGQLAAMERELRDHREEFLTAPETLDFEKRWMEEYLTDRSEQQLDIKRFCIPVTLRCNLRCKLCAERAPYYQQPYDPELRDLTGQIDALFTLADRITMFDITGGEPLLRKDLPRLVRYLHIQYGGRIGKLRLTTNGTLLPGEELLESLKLWAERVYVIVDHYPVSTKFQEAACRLEAAGIPFEVRDYSENLHCDGWVDYGDFRKKHDPAGARKLFNACMIPKLDFFACLVDGKLFPCARARLLYEQGITRDCLDIAALSGTGDTGRAALGEFLRRTFAESCAYCNGLCEDSPRFAPAEQLERRPRFIS